MNHSDSQTSPSSLWDGSQSIGYEPWREAYPWVGEWLTLRDGRLHYIDGGAPTVASTQLRAPQTILCVHGNPTWSYYFRQVVSRFGRSARVVVPDHLGMGLSDKPSGAVYTYAAHRDRLVHLIDHLDLRSITLVAHDWGGAIGLGAALQRPGRFSRLILLNTGAFPPPYVPWRIAICRWPLLGPFLVRGCNIFARAAIHMAMSQRRLSARDRQGLLYPYDSWAHRIGIWNFVHDIPMHSDQATWRELAQLEVGLQQLRHLPVTLIWGMRDWCFRRECLTRLQQAFPDARTVELADAGHYVLEDAPDEVLHEIAESCRLNEG